ncbi:HTH domain-containing protein [Candidatus Hecatella orcuttiae]|jgi:DNA-binding Lrp family transcriptional regulator|uniref:HTH domain-containing protein n=1 Tax=Candidatus Hecatella orcuttiae TaxID=1935119 RepID=UPI002867B451|nr:HTH domain-containing protein [Candidatus Hecatella orcuttiae]
MERKPVIEGTFSRLFETPLGRVLDVLILHRGYDLSLKELANYAGISPKTLWKTMAKLESLGIVKHTRRIGNAKMITFNQDSNPLGEHLIALEYSIPLKEMES